MAQCQAGPSRNNDSVKNRLSRCSMSSESSNCSTTPLVSSKQVIKYSSVQRSQSYYYDYLDDDDSSEVSYKVKGNKKMFLFIQ